MHSIVLTNAAATYGHMILVVAAFVLTLSVTRLGVSSRDTMLERNKRKSNGWPI
jgi:hypothetical protein